MPEERFMKIISAIPWVEDENGVLWSHYGKDIFYIWNDEVMGWSYQLNEDFAQQADSHAEALQGCARLLAQKMAAAKR